MFPTVFGLLVRQAAGSSTETFDRFLRLGQENVSTRKLEKWSTFIFTMDSNKSWYFRFNLRSIGDNFHNLLF